LEDGADVSAYFRVFGDEKGGAVNELTATL